MKTMEAAKGRWPGILRALGVDEQFLRDRHGECPLCGGTDRYRFDDNNGEGGYFCNHCGAGDGMKLLMGITGKSFGEVARAIDEIVGNVEVSGAAKSNRPDPVLRLRKLARALVPMDDINPVSCYLKGRGLRVSRATKFCPAWGYYDQGVFVRDFPTMVHLFQSHDGAPVTYHTTYLDGTSKASVGAPKKILTPNGSMTGGAIRLFPAAKVMGIAEGIETALAAQKMYGTATWASYSANLLEQWQPPAGVELVRIFGDNDESFTGQSAAFNLAKRLKREGYKVIATFPDIAGSDYADAVNG